MAIHLERICGKKLGPPQAQQPQFLCQPQDRGSLARGHPGGSRARLPHPPEIESSVSGLQGQQNHPDQAK